MAREAEERGGARVGDRARERATRRAREGGARERVSVGAGAVNLPEGRRTWAAGEQRNGRRFGIKCWDGRNSLGVLS